MLRSLYSPTERANPRSNPQLDILSLRRHSSNIVDNQVWATMCLAYLLSALIECASPHPTAVLADVLTAIGYLLPPIGLRVVGIERRKVWWTATFLFWIGQISMLIQTGGVFSPYFGAQMFLLFLVTVGVFVTWSLGRIFGVLLLHVSAWAAVSFAFHLKVPGDLTSIQIVVQNVLALLSGVGLVFTISKTTEIFADQYEVQTRRLTETQNHLCHAEKMAEIGKLVATTAHELSQPVQVIVTAASLMRRAAHDPSKYGEVSVLSEQVTEASSRLNRLLNQLRNFSRKEPFVLKDINLSDAVRAVHLLSQYDLRWNGVKCDVELADGPLWIHGDSMRIQQVLFNLINNARDACGQVENPCVRVSAQTFRNWVRVRVWNNGEAIPLSIQSRLFQPYFTTKEAGRGTGLGLTICQQLIDQHGGRILFSSEDGNTSFVIDLPMAIQPAQPAPVARLHDAQ